jgi:ParB family transcriptional regulator, chromosome partitioning protein
VELVPRTTAPRQATGAVEFVPLDAVSVDPTFRLREVGDVSALAASIARLGQLVPIELRALPGAGDGPVRFQVVAGFRRLAAVRLLGRSRVLARVHARLDEDDAFSLGLVQALLDAPLSPAELEALRARLGARGQTSWAEELIEEAQARAAPPPPAEGTEAADAEDLATAAAARVDEPGATARAATPAPAEAEVEVTPEELAADLAGRMWQVNQDVSLAVDAWDELPEEARRMILDQARYLAELYPYLAGGRR